MEKSHCYRFVIFDTGQIKVDSYFRISGCFGVVNVSKIEQLNLPSIVILSGEVLK